MKPRSFDRLCIALLDPYYFPRKEADQLCCIVNLEDEKIYPVPVEIEHVDFAGLILKNNIQNNPGYASRFIPSNLRIDALDRVVRKIITGVSGMEIGYNVRHTFSDVDLAHSLIKDFVFRGEFPCRSIEEEVVYRYCIK